MPDGIKNLKCIKYTLMTINSFGLIIGIFVVLFGLAYPTVTFPGGYVGKETAGFAGLFIFFSLVGYCGAHHMKLFFLVPYIGVIGLGLVLNVFRWISKREKTCLDAKGTIVVSFTLFPSCDPQSSLSAQSSHSSPFPALHAFALSSLVASLFSILVSSRITLDVSRKSISSTPFPPLSPSLTPTRFFSHNY